jgi:hypothetical protein
MLGGGDKDAFFHEAGGVADAGDVSAVGFDLEAVKIGAAEDDSRSGRSRKDAHDDGSAAVQSDSTASHG